MGDKVLDGKHYSEIVNYSFQQFKDGKRVCAEFGEQIVVRAHWTTQDGYPELEHLFLHHYLSLQAFPIDAK